ncbi:DUF2637 domain-containing protein [Streptomyces sp. 21So2-11]|uniref:DUF2637 domain-containing protein n=1 Tax=Streptomyces sp. 21So2-11 TaxID=3144408 RepID=UPI003219CE20
MTSVQIRSAERALSVGTWLIVGGAMLYSILTVTPLMAAHTPDDWAWTAPILPLVVDAAVVIVVRLDAVLAQLGGQGGRWPTALRWMTGAMTLALNVADSALQRDLVGVAVHSVSPLLLIVTAESGLAYRRAIAAATAALLAQERAERAEREQAVAQRAEAAVQRAEAATLRAREEREHQAQLVREQREHEARLVREQAEREERAHQAERERAEALEREARVERERREREREQQQRDRERLEREAAERAEGERRERVERERREQEREQQQREHERAALLSGGPATERLPEERAREIVRAAVAAGLPVRAAVELTGWSIGWISSRYQELRDADQAGAPLLNAVASATP